MFFLELSTKFRFVTLETRYFVFKSDQPYKQLVYRMLHSRKSTIVSTTKLVNYRKAGFLFVTAIVVHTLTVDTFSDTLVTSFKNLPRTKLLE